MDPIIRSSPNFNETTTKVSLLQHKKNHRNLFTSIIVEHTLNYDDTRHWKNFIDSNFTYPCYYLRMTSRYVFYWNSCEIFKFSYFVTKTNKQEIQGSTFLYKNVLEHELTQGLSPRSLIIHGMKYYHCFLKILYNVQYT